MSRKRTDLIIALMGVILIAVSTLTIICLPVPKENLEKTKTTDMIYRAAEELGFDEKETEKVFGRKNISINETSRMIEEGADPFSTTRLVLTNPDRQYSETTKKIIRVTDVCILLGFFLIVVGILDNDIQKRRYRENLSRRLSNSRMLLLELREFAAFLDEGYKAGAEWSTPEIGAGWSGDDGIDGCISKALFDFPVLMEEFAASYLTATIKLVDEHIRNTIRKATDEFDEHCIGSVLDFVKNVDEDNCTSGFSKAILNKEILTEAASGTIENLRDACIKVFGNCKYMNLYGYLNLMYRYNAWKPLTDYTISAENGEDESEPAEAEQLEYAMDDPISKDPEPSVDEDYEETAGTDITTDGSEGTEPAAIEEKTEEEDLVVTDPQDDKDIRHDNGMFLQAVSLLKYIDGMMSDNKLTPKEITSLKGVFASWPSDDPKGNELCWLISPFIEDKNRPKVAAVRQLRNEISDLIGDLIDEGYDADDSETLGVAFRALALGLTTDNTFSDKDAEALKDWFEGVGIDESYTADPAIAGVYSVWKNGEGVVELFNCLRNVGCLYLGKG